MYTEFLRLVTGWFPYSKEKHQALFSQLFSEKRSVFHKYNFESIETRVTHWRIQESSQKSRSWCLYGRATVHQRNLVSAVGMVMQINVFKSLKYSVLAKLTHKISTLSNQWQQVIKCLTISLNKTNSFSSVCYWLSITLSANYVRDFFRRTRT